jgi:outer membrane protein OmpA-like peptidoglycan-associated protein
MGKGINTPQTEMTPFYDQTFSRFYFSSDGHKNIGMLDVFKVDGNVGDWGEVLNLGYPVNSPVDDIYLKLNEEGEIGYMVSNREGTTSPRGKTCCDDIWNVAVIQPRDLVLKGYFTSKKDPEKKPIAGVEASLYAIDGNNFEFIDNTITSDEEMFYFALEPGTDYKMNGSKEGFWPSVDNIETPDEISENDTIFKIFYIEPVIRQVIPVKRVYFAFDKSDVREIYADRLDSIYLAMTSNEELFLKITGHTDSKGTEAYNQKLSERRAKAAKDFLAESGIDEERIETEGKGELEPIAQNSFPDGRDNPEGRAKNRRVEFELITDDETIEIDYIYDDPLVIE